MCRPCIVYILSELVIISGLLNLLVVMATADCVDYTCTAGQYFNCSSCVLCPPGTFNKEVLHRNLSCKSYRSKPHPDCWLSHNGTHKTDIEWNCFDIATSTAVTSTTVTSTTVLYNVTTIHPTVATVESTLILVIIIISAVCFLLIIIAIVCFITWKKKKKFLKLSDAAFEMHKLNPT